MEQTDPCSEMEDGLCVFQTRGRRNRSKTGRSIHQTEQIRALEVPAAGFVSAITIEFDRAAGAFTGRTAILTVGLSRTGTGRIFALVLIVGHLVPPSRLFIEERRVLLFFRLLKLDRAVSL